MLVVLGFMATDFTLTITLSAADAAVHLLGNPLAPPWLQGHQVGLTLFLIALLGFVFYLASGRPSGRRWSSPWVTWP